MRWPMSPLGPKRPILRRNRMSAFGVPAQPVVNDLQRHFAARLRRSAVRAATPNYK
jgi:hypothetical protein